jgi:hypothetical protein
MARNTQAAGVKSIRKRLLIPSASAWGAGGLMIEWVRERDWLAQAV